MTVLKKTFSLLLSLVMAVFLAVPANAEETNGSEEPTYSITINSPDKGTIVGKTFAVYKIFDAHYNADTQAITYSATEAFQNYNYTPTGSDETYYANADVTQGQKKLSDYLEALKESDNASEIEKFAKNVAAYISENEIPAADGPSTAEEKTLVFSNLAIGYYIVLDETPSDAKLAESASMLTTVIGNTAITAKIAVPTLDKYIVDEDENGEEKLTTTNTASIGDTVNFKLESMVPDMTGYTKAYYFIVKDTLDKGLTFDSTSVKITIDGTELTAGTDYTVTETKNTEDGTTSVKIVFKDFLIKWKSSKGKDIVITYSATLNSDATTGNTANKNGASLQYSNDVNYDHYGENPDHPDEPGDDPDSKEPVGETEDSITETYTAVLKIVKLDNEGKALPGATFELTGTTLNQVRTKGIRFEEAENGTYYLLKSGEYTTTAPTEEGVDASLYADDGKTYNKVSYDEMLTDDEEETTSVSSVTNIDGEIYFEGLKKGSYSLKETDAPDGYKNDLEGILVNL